MRFLDLLPPSRVQSGVFVRDKGDLVETLARLLSDNDAEVSVMRDALAARERLGTTGLGHGVAIPHGRSAQVENARAAFVRLADPIDFGASDGQPVDLVAALIVPAHFTDQHLQLLAALAKFFSKSELTSTLRATADDHGLYEEIGRAMS